VKVAGKGQSVQSQVDLLRSAMSPYDCGSCGACCHVFIVDVTDYEAASIPEEFLDVDKHGGYVMGTKSKNQEGCGECAAHDGEMGVSSRCTIYEERSVTCRDFGSKSDCDRARYRAGLPITKAVNQ